MPLEFIIKVIFIGESYETFDFKRMLVKYHSRVLVQYNRYLYFEIFEKFLKF